VYFVDGAARGIGFEFAQHLLKRPKAIVRLHILMGRVAARIC